mmetsp:Transcript_6346/g.10728  ORF Transcript_6346/g.10728 Transcript_6346/m.10728 type:complete len:102 (-) Transcript_6346:1939-2244(-)
MFGTWEMQTYNQQLMVNCETEALTNLCDASSIPCDVMVGCCTDLVYTRKQLCSFLSILPQVVHGKSDTYFDREAIHATNFLSTDWLHLEATLLRRVSHSLN